MRRHHLKPHCLVALFVALALALFGAVGLSMEARADIQLDGYVDTGIGHQNASWLFLVEPGLSLQSEALQLNLLAPLRFDMNENFQLWRSDWDDLSDAGRVIRKAAISLNDGAFRMTLGALTHISFGHGTMVQSFISSLDPDTMPLGASLFIQAGPVTVEAMVSDIFGPEVFGGSLSIEPVSLFGSTYDRLHLIASFVADPKSPVIDLETGLPNRDSAWVFLYGFGLDWAVVRNQVWQLAPYVDANVNGRGFGFHAGLMADVVFTHATVSMRGEWRWAKAPYAPDYFDVAYTLERRDFSPNSELPLSQAQALDDVDLGHSGKVELRVESGAISATGTFAAIGQDIFNASAILHADMGSVDFSLFGVLRHFKFGGDIDRILGMGEIRYRFLKYFYTWFSGGHLYRFNEDNRAKGTFVWSAGIGASWTLAKGGQPKDAPVASPAIDTVNAK